MGELFILGGEDFEREAFVVTDNDGTVEISVDTFRDCKEWLRFTGVEYIGKTRYHYFVHCDYRPG